MPENAVEGDIVQGTIVSPYPVNGDIEVYLSSKDIQVLSVQKMVTIPHGLTSVIFDASGVVDVSEMGSDQK